MDHRTLAPGLLTSGADYDRYEPAFPPQALEVVLPDSLTPAQSTAVHLFRSGASEGQK